MKSFLLLAATAALVLAQDAKVDPKSVGPSALQERTLSELELTKWKLDNAEITKLRAVYKIDDYLKAIQPFVDDQDKIGVEACRSVGVPEKDIKTGGCGFTSGLDQDNKPLIGQDGKALAPHPRYIKIVRFMMQRTSDGQ